MVNFHYMKLSPGEKITLLRLKAGTSQAETAALLNISLEVYVKFEEDFLYPSDLMLHKIARFYGLTYDELLAVGEPP